MTLEMRGAANVGGWERSDSPKLRAILEQIDSLLSHNASTHTRTESVFMARAELEEARDVLESMLETRPLQFNQEISWYQGNWWPEIPGIMDYGTGPGKSPYAAFDDSGQPRPVELNIRPGYIKRFGGLMTAISKLNGHLVKVVNVEDEADIRNLFESIVAEAYPADYALRFVDVISQDEGHVTIKAIMENTWKYNTVNRTITQTFVGLISKIDTWSKHCNTAKPTSPVPIKGVLCLAKPKFGFSNVREQVSIGEVDGGAPAQAHDFYSVKQVGARLCPNLQVFTEAELLIVEGPNSQANVRVNPSLLGKFVEAENAARKACEDASGGSKCKIADKEELPGCVILEDTCPVN